MKVSFVVALMVLAVATAGAQSTSGKNTVSVTVQLDSATRPDSAALRAALASGVAGEASLSVVERQRGAASRYLVNAMLLSRGAMVRVEVRAVDVVTGNVLARESANVARADLSSGLTSVARLVASKLVK